MQKIVLSNYEELSVETAKRIAGIIKQKPDALLCFPAGETALGTFAVLVNLQKKGKINFSHCKIVGLDEWVHLAEMKKENCYSFLKKHFFDYLDIKPGNLCFFNGEANDLVNECQVTDRFIKSNGGIDLMLLGLGMNGHLGLNEPGSGFETDSHLVFLDEVTQKVGQKYFSSVTILSQGITLGLKQVMESGCVILQASGSKKLPIVKKLIESSISNKFPASILHRHQNAFLLLDQEANPEKEVKYG